jgi:hypothetical protein
MNGTMEDVTQAQPFIPGGEKREPRLLDRVRDALRVRHMSLRTEKTYVHWSAASSSSIRRGIPRTWPRRRSMPS